MTEEDSVALVRRPPSAVEDARAGAKRIQSTIVADVLALTKKQQSTPVAAKFRIGQHEWCEPDYRQILIWAEALKLKPEEVIERLLKGRRRADESWRETRFENGRLLKIHWDADLLPLNDFQMGDGLRTTHFAVSAALHWGVWGGWLGLKLPHLTHLACGNGFLTEIDLSGCPRLHFLDCAFNSISHLDLTSVPNLTELYCVGNDIEELDLSPVPRLIKLNCMANSVGRKVKGLKRLTMPRLPDLTSLSCSSNSLSSLGLSGLPNLTFLDCCKNEICRLDLNDVPLLEELFCHSNPMGFLDIRPLHHLKHCCWKDVMADSCEIHLIQRSDQHFRAP